VSLKNFYPVRRLWTARKTE